jgi:signal transduction histidine kinase
MRLLPLHSRRIVIGSLLCLLLVLGCFALRAYLHSPNRGLPYRDSFAKGTADEWKAFGGTWELANGLMRNDSDERGAKLVTGSPYWHNYSIEGDVSLLGLDGDAGLIIRSGNEEEGVNSYSGYYAGIRKRDNALVLGRAEYGWMEVIKQSPRPGAIRPFQWYHLKLLGYDCQIVATVSSLSQATHFSLNINDQDCVYSGRVGLRSYLSGGTWRNIVVRPAGHQDLAEMLRGMEGQGNLEPKDNVSEDSEFLGGQHLPAYQQSSARSNTNIQTIASLGLASSSKPAIATIRGVVVLATPLLFVQDSTGGVYIPQPTASTLKIGDEVEVTGEVHPGDFSSTLERASVQVLWERTPVPPVSVTASQASTGKYDATFIEVQGRLTGKGKGTTNTLLLDLDDGTQSFRAIMNPGRSDYLFNKLKLNSSIRLRGICVVDSSFTHNLTPFALLLRSNEDLEVLAGPPWWSTGHIVAIVFAVLLLALITNFFYHRLAHWHLQGVLEERQRMAHEMHDTLAQSFAGIGFQLQAIRNGLSGEASTLLQQLDLASNLVRHSHEEARRSIATLRPESLESQDIPSTLRTLAMRMVDGGTVQVIAEETGDIRPIPLRIADTLLRIGQEAVANAVRHAHPTQLTIHLSYSEDSVRLLIEDNGIGFLQDESPRGFGIRGMRKRAQSISATFKIDSRQGEGTRIQATAPLPPRLTVTSWPKLFWKFVKEHRFDARSQKHASSDFNRR